MEYLENLAKILESHGVHAFAAVLILAVIYLYLDNKKLNKVAREEGRDSASAVVEVTKDMDESMRWVTKALESMDGDVQKVVDLLNKVVMLHGGGTTIGVIKRGKNDEGE